MSSSNWLISIFSIWWKLDRSPSSCLSSGAHEQAKRAELRVRGKSGSVVLFFWEGSKWHRKSLKKILMRLYQSPWRFVRFTILAGARCDGIWRAPIYRWEGFKGYVRILLIFAKSHASEAPNIRFQNVIFLTENISFSQWTLCKRSPTPSSSASHSTICALSYFALLLRSTSCTAATTPKCSIKNCLTTDRSLCFSNFSRCPFLS